MRTDPHAAQAHVVADMQRLREKAGFVTVAIGAGVLIILEARWTARKARRWVKGQLS